ncbi:nanos homolog 1-like [Tachypleus tridentatus]|uniref:nanos homolog 1-like n=1 Tax=Tachypleus tridentatus TaxID=6853 RepID=UPI003FD1CC77
MQKLLSSLETMSIQHQMNYVRSDFVQNGKDSDFLTVQGPTNKQRPPKKRKKRPQECVFCKNNGEEVRFYKSHVLRNTSGKIVCPILRRYNCPICQNGGGDTAHTIRYCPKNKFK